MTKKIHWLTGQYILFPFQKDHGVKWKTFVVAPVTNLWVFSLVLKSIPRLTYKGCVFTARAFPPPYGMIEWQFPHISFIPQRNAEHGQLDIAHVALTVVVQEISLSETRF